MSKSECYLKAYQVAINHIDDYFEYRNESKADREFIHKVLQNLTTRLAAIDIAEIL